jgi:O-antigen/teichoic acid export membrane protein
MAIIQLVTRLADLGAVVVLLPFGVMGVAWSFVIVAGFEWMLTAGAGVWEFRRQAGTLRGADYRRAWREFRPFAVYGSLLGSLQALTSNLDVIVLGALRPPAEVGFYTIARSGAQVLSTALGPVSQSVYPLMNEAWALNDRDRVRRLIGRLMTINGGVSAAAVVFLYFTADWLVAVFYGAPYLPAGAVLRLMVIFIGLQTVTGWMHQMIIIAGYPRLDLASGILGTGFFLVLLVPFVQRSGAVGVALLLILDVCVMVTAFGWILTRRIRLWSTSAASVVATEERISTS